MTIGHNSKTTKAGPVNADRLKSFIERIEKLEEERKAIGGDIKDVYSEAKGVGYDVATMRKIVALRAKDAADVAEAETLLDIYKHALGMDTIGHGGAAREPSEEELVEIAGRIAGEVDRCMALVRSGKLPKIEDIKRLIGCSNGKAQKLRGMIATRLEQFSRLSTETRENPKPEDGDDGITESPAGPAEGVVDQQIAAQQDPQVVRIQPTATPVPEGREGTGTHSESSGERVEPLGASDQRLICTLTTALLRPDDTLDQAPATPSVGAVAAEPRVAPPFLGDDPGPPPEFLRRRVA